MTLETKTLLEMKIKMKMEIILIIALKPEKKPLLLRAQLIKILSLEIPLPRRVTMQKILKRDQTKMAS